MGFAGLIPSSSQLRFQVQRLLDRKGNQLFITGDALDEGTVFATVGFNVTYVASVTAFELMLL